MVRNILAVIAAFIGGGIFVFVVEAIGHQFFPPPTGLDFAKPETVAEYAKNAPVGALLFVLLAQSSGSFFGGLISGLIAVSKNTTAIIYGVLALAMAALNAFLIPHPIWFLIPSLLLPIPLSLLGTRVAGTLVKS
jgi:hypothetical protein